jgi:hypothetical protein
MTIKRRNKRLGKSIGEKEGKDTKKKGKGKN